MGMLKNTKFSLLVCEMFYQRGMSQKEISAELGISRSQICRVIASAVESGLVTIAINYPNAEEGEYQRLISEKYGISEVYIYDIGGDETELGTQNLATVSQGLYQIFLKDNTRVGVMAGKSVRAVVDAIPRTTSKGLEFVALCGGSQNNGSAWNANVIANNFAFKTGGKYYTLNAPQFLQNAETRVALFEEPSIKEVLEIGKNCDVAFLGIGAVDLNSTTTKANKFINTDIIALKNSGAVASICGSYLDQNGKIVAREIGSRIVGLSIDELSKTRKIGIAIGKDKHEAIKATLKGKHIDVLVTSLETARHLI